MSLASAVCIFALLGGPNPARPYPGPLEGACRAVQAALISERCGWSASTDSSLWCQIVCSWNEDGRQVIAPVIARLTPRCGDPFQAVGRIQVLAHPCEGGDCSPAVAWSQGGGMLVHSIGIGYANFEDVTVEIPDLSIAGHAERKRLAEELRGLLPAGWKCGVYQGGESR